MTYVLGVIGDPIEHSLSPVMQMAAIKAAEIDATYKAFHIKADELASFVDRVRRENFLGFNITIPHKQDIMAYLDEISPEAEAIGAVNTVVNVQGQLTGHNTDAIGYIRSLQEEKQWKPHGKVVTVLGAGGAARAVAYGLLEHDVQQLYIANRSPDKAEALCNELGKLFVDRISFVAWKQLPAYLKKSDLLLNATAVGLGGTRFEQLDLSQLPQHALVSDLVYAPAETPLLHEAKQAGYTTHGGLGMLLYQGAEAFRLWFKQAADVEIMRRALTEELGN